MADTGDRVPCVFVKNGLVENLDPNDPIEVSYRQNFPGEPTGKNNPELLTMHPSHGHDNSIVNGISLVSTIKVLNFNTQTYKLFYQLHKLPCCYHVSVTAVLGIFHYPKNI